MARFICGDKDPEEPPTRVFLEADGEDGVRICASNGMYQQTLGKITREGQFKTFLLGTDSAKALGIDQNPTTNRIRII